MKVYNSIAERLDENSDYDGKWAYSIEIGVLKV